MESKSWSWRFIVTLLLFLGVVINLETGLRPGTVLAAEPEKRGEPALAEIRKGELLGWIKGRYFKDFSFNYQLLRTLGWTYGGAADIGECLETATRITEGDELSWYTEWKKTADRIYEIAVKSEAGGHKISAGQAYLRGSNYYRTADFYMHADPRDPRSLEASARSVEAFQKAIKLLSIPAEVIRIPYEGTTLPGYFYRSPHAPGRGPLVILQTGFDGTAEELYYGFGSAGAAIQRGYHCLVFEGPGQGQAVRKQNLTFRHDWEKVVTPVVDYALTRAEVDPGRIALYGISLGGYLAPRAAAFEPRIKVCIANGGIIDFAAGVFAHVPPPVLDLLEKNPEDFNEAFAKVVEKNTMLRWFLRDGKWRFGASSPADLMAKIKSFNLVNEAGRIKTPMLVIDGEAEGYLRGQSEKLFRALSGPKEFMVFTGMEAAEAHCQSGAKAVHEQRVFDWLDRFWAK